MLDTLERLVMIIVKFVNNQDKLKTIILYYKSGLVNALERVFMTSTYIIWWLANDIQTSKVHILINKQLRRGKSIWFWLTI